MKKLILLLVVIFSLNIYGQAGLQSLVQQGMEQALNMDLNAAEKTFNRILDRYPDKPHGYYYIAKLHFWIFLGTCDVGEYIVFEKFADMAQKKIDEILDNDDNNYRIEYMAGNLASWRAMAHATNDAKVDAFWASKKAVEHFENTIKINPRFYDAYLGLGLFDYAMSFIPDFLRWAVNLTGLSSDKERGLNYIITAYNKGTVDKVEAGFHLSKIYADYLAEYDSSAYYVRNLISLYPNNTLFRYQHAVALIHLRKLDKALQELNQIIRLNIKQLPQITALAHFRKGEIYYKKNQFRSALKEFEKFLDTSKELDLTGIASYYSAICNKMLKNDSEYERCLILAKGGNQDLFDDSYAKVKAEKYIAGEITEDDLKLIRYKNYIDSDIDKIAFDSLDVFIKGAKENDIKNLARAYFIEASYNLGKYLYCVTTAEKIIGAELKEDKWVQPYAYLIIAKSNYQVGEEETAMEMLGKAEEKNNFEFKDKIQAEIENLKRKLNKKGN